MSSDSDSNHSFLSEHSDGGDLPFFPTFSSPTKNGDQVAAAPSSVGSPGGILTATLSAASISTPEKIRDGGPPAVNLDHFSPHQSQTDKKALEHSRKLARKAEELAKRIKTKRDRNEKVDLTQKCLLLITVTVPFLNIDRLRITSDVEVFVLYRTSGRRLRGVRHPYLIAVIMRGLFQEHRLPIVIYSLSCPKNLLDRHFSSSHQISSPSSTLQATRKTLLIMRPCLPMWRTIY